MTARPVTFTVPAEAAAMIVVALDDRARLVARRAEDALDFDKGLPMGEPARLLGESVKYTKLADTIRAAMKEKS